MNAPFPSADLAKALGKTSLSPEVQRQLDMRDFISRSRNDFAVLFFGARTGQPLAPKPLGCNLGFAKSAAIMLTDAERVALMVHLLDVTEFDAPDLRTEAETILNDIAGAVE
jgi:hypothetical protein